MKSSSSTKAQDRLRRLCLWRVSTFLWAQYLPQYNIKNWELWPNLAQPAKVDWPVAYSGIIGKAVVCPTLARLQRARYAPAWARVPDWCPRPPHLFIFPRKSDMFVFKRSIYWKFTRCADRCVIRNLLSAMGIYNCFSIACLGVTVFNGGAFENRRRMRMDGICLHFCLPAS